MFCILILYNLRFFFVGLTSIYMYIIIIKILLFIWIVDTLLFLFGFSMILFICFVSYTLTFTSWKNNKERKKCWNKFRNAFITLEGSLSYVKCLSWCVYQLHHDVVLVLYSSHFILFQHFKKFRSILMVLRSIKYPFSKSIMVFLLF